MFEKMVFEEDEESLQDRILSKTAFDLKSLNIFFSISSLGIKFRSHFIEMALFPGGGETYTSPKIIYRKQKNQF